MTSSFPTDRPPPSQTSYILATAILCLTLGYFVGQGRSLFSPFSSPSSTKTKTKPNPKPKSSWPNSYDVAVHPDSSDSELMAHVKREGVRIIQDSEEDSDSSTSSSETKINPNSFPESLEEHKLVLVVRTDLGMSKGKIAAQCSHATLACYKALLPKTTTSPSPILKKWESSGQPKIALQTPSSSHLDSLHAKALSLGLCARVVHDAGRTQIASGTKTVLGVGPGPKSVVDEVTGGLKLL